MTRLIDLKGQKFGRLTVITHTGSDKHGKARWMCQCECGTKAIVVGIELRKGDTQSCGCLRDELLGQRVRTHGMWGTPEYYSFNSAIQRCTNESDASYINYGGRGIEFRFESFDQFYKELGSRPSAKHSGDRIDVDGHYEVGNVRWTTSEVQSWNTRIRVDNTTGYRGVSLRTNGRYQVSINQGNKQVHVGYFKDDISAAKAYDAKAIELRGSEAKLNFASFLPTLTSAVGQLATDVK